MTASYVRPVVLAVLALGLFAVGFSAPLSWWAWPVISAAVVLGAVAAVGFINLADPPDPAQDTSEAAGPAVWPTQNYDQEAA